MGIYKCGVFFLKIKLSFAHITIKVQSFNYALNPRFSWGAHVISSKVKKKRASGEAVWCHVFPYVKFYTVQIIKHQTSGERL